jgi:hypothetical protein
LKNFEIISYISDVQRVVVVVLVLLAVVVVVVAAVRPKELNQGLARGV